MRKILAILLAVVMLLSAAALAEGSAAVMTVSNVNMQTGGQAIAINGMDLHLVLQNVNNLPSVALLVDGDGQALATAVAQLSSKAFSFAVDGMDHGYTMDLPAEQAAQLAEVGDDGMAILLPLLLVPALDSAVLPPFAGANIPKADMTGLLSGFMTGANTFEIPYEQVNALLDQVLQVAKSQGSAIEGLNDAIEMVDQLKSSGMGVAIRGDIADDGATQTVTGNIHLAQNGTVMDEPIATLTVVTAENSFNASLGVAGDGVMTASLVSDPAAARIDFNLDVAGAAGATFALFNEDGLQKANLDINGGSESGSALLEFAYGEQNGSDVVHFGGTAGGSTIALDVNTVKGADGVRTGTLSLIADDTAISGDVTMYTGDEIDLGGFTMPSDLRSFEQIDGDAISAAFEPVMDFLGTHATMG